MSMMEIGKRLERMNNKNIRAMESADQECVDENCLCKSATGKTVAVEPTKLTKAGLKQIIQEALREAIELN